MVISYSYYLFTYAYTCTHTVHTYVYIECYIIHVVLIHAICTGIKQGEMRIPFVWSSTVGIPTRTQR